MHIDKVLDRNEATVQAELYRVLYDNGIKSYLEVKIKNPFRKLNSIADIAVVDKSGEITYLIEVKSKPRSKLIKKAKTIQEQRYEEISKAHDIPFTYCYGYEDIERVVKLIKDI